MKQLILTLAIVMSAAIGFAQGIGTPPEAPAAGAEMKAAAKAASTLHYYYHNKHMVECMGNSWKDLPENVKIGNGTVVTLKGEVAYRHWTKIVKLKDGECVDLNGNIMDHKKAHDEMASTN